MVLEGWGRSLSRGKVGVPGDKTPKKIFLLVYIRFFYSVRRERDSLGRGGLRRKWKLRLRRDVMSFREGVTVLSGSTSAGRRRGINPIHVFVILRNHQGMIHVKGSEMMPLEYNVAGIVDIVENVLMSSYCLCF